MTTEGNGPAYFFDGYPPPPCRHRVILTFYQEDGNGQLWACEACRRRFYPACPTCVSVGHRNEDHEGLLPDRDSLVGALLSCDIGRTDLRTPDAGEDADALLAALREAKP